MKKYTKHILIIAAFAAALICMMAVASFADTTYQAGMYDLTTSGVTTSGGVTMVPQTSAGAVVSGKSATIDSESTTLYEGAERVLVTIPNTTEGSFYLNLTMSGDSSIPTKDNLVYIDQVTGDGNALKFNVYPSSLAAKNTYRVYYSSNDGTALTEVGSFKYYVPYKLGDVNENSEIEINDVVWTLESIASKRTLTENQRLAAKVTLTEGDPNITDAVWILENIAGKREF